MKKLIIISVFLGLLSSCTVSKFAAKEVYLLDFRPYAEKGFLMSTTNIGTNYSSIGEITLVCQSGFIKPEAKSKKTSGWQDEDVYGPSVSRKSPKKIWTINDVLESLYKEASATGANGIINIKLETTTFAGYTDFTISGLAVKISK